jgi:type II secretory pathway pseudopilin PulG
MKRLRARLGPPEAGLTLIELIVAAGMSIVLVAAASSMLISAVKHQPKLSKRAQDVSSARWVLERFTREIRNGVRVDKYGSSSTVSFVTQVRRTACGGATPLSSEKPAIRCQVTYQCTTTSCARIEANEGIYTGTGTKVFEGIDSSEVFCYVPSANPDPTICGPAGASPPTYIGVTLRLPNPTGVGSLKISDGASLRNATLSN